ncbi:helix-turn-helix transcriptional regulator [Streptomyces sp. L2]|uniref:helix-turn-helix domain-containing protein n=1 Tax=Streptomyces sp. L2 TaxID=2162665 RepID=UPI001013192E|nr:helix-turn-helix transcriptional regulator [Streptomyces sp. L2]
MTDFEAIDGLLARAKKEVPLPPVDERRRLREEVNISRAQLARALGVSPSTVGGWESGRDPSGEVREKYAYFLDGARAKLAAQTADTTLAAATVPSVSADADADEQHIKRQDHNEDVDVLATPQPCVLCGQPAPYQVAGFPQHLDPTECGRSAHSHAARPADEPQRAPTQTPPSKERRRLAPAARQGQPGDEGSGVKVVPVGRRLKTADSPNPIHTAVEAALAEHSGDVEAATEALIKRAIPDAMALLDHTRKGGRYDVIAHPWLPDVLHKQSSRGADQIWEARPKWTRPELPTGEHQVTALDINGAYLSALKTHLPLGQLEHSTGDQHDRRRAGVHLITPPDWEHDAYLPNPIGSRDEPGPLWVTEPTLRLLLRVSGPKYGLCDPPRIHESWTSGATEGLLEKFRVALKDARDRAITDDDEVTLAYVKAMYSKFVSTLGESNYNRELYRTDWMHLIRSQAFANLWWKAHRAYDEGLLVVRAMGTDELHLIGDWRMVFQEGRGVAEVKIKDAYSVGAPSAD